MQKPNLEHSWRMPLGLQLRRCPGPKEQSCLSAICWMIWFILVSPQEVYKEPHRQSLVKLFDDTLKQKLANTVWRDRGAWGAILPKVITKSASCFDCHLFIGILLTMINQRFKVAIFPCKKPPFAAQPLVVLRGARRVSQALIGKSHPQAKLREFHRAGPRWGVFFHGFSSGSSPSCFWSTWGVFEISIIAHHSPFSLIKRH